MDYLHSGGAYRRVDTGDGAFIIYDPSFAKVIGEAAGIEMLVATDAHEGPVYLKDQDALYFTTVPAADNVPVANGKSVGIKRYRLSGNPTNEIETVREPSNMANGMTLRRNGRLLVCEQGNLSQAARISQVDPTSGKAKNVVSDWFGLRFNSPNDIVEKSDGTIWFTDPSYGYLQGFKPAPQVGDFVYRYDPVNDALTVVADSFDKPNGLAFSPCETILYVTDSGAIQGPGTYESNRPHHVRAFDVTDAGTLVGDRLFAVVSPGIPDGIKLDSKGNVYTSASDGIHVYNPSGVLIGIILLQGGAANFCFGGTRNKTLLVCTDTAVVAVHLNVKGAV